VNGSDKTIYRYWNPRAVESDSDWIDELAAFEDLLVAAVERFLKMRSGFDSVSVAAIAADLAKGGKFARPWALSMAFRNSEADEEDRQRAVAQQLGLPQEFVRFQERGEGGGFLQPTLELSSQMTFPLLNRWLTRHSHLVEIGKQRGCRGDFDWDWRRRMARRFSAAYSRHDSRTRLRTALRFVVDDPKIVSRFGAKASKNLDLALWAGSTDSRGGDRRSEPRQSRVTGGGSARALDEFDASGFSLTARCGANWAIESRPTRPRELAIRVLTEAILRAPVYRWTIWTIQIEST